MRREGSGGRIREGRGGLSGNVAEMAFCLKSALGVPQLTRHNTDLNYSPRSQSRKEM